MTPTTAWRFTDLSSDVAAFALAVAERAADLRGEDPNMGVKAARNAAREQLLLDGQRFSGLLLRAS